MSCSDFVGDFLTAVRNASKAGKEKITVKGSNLTLSIAKILEEEGFVRQVKEFKEGEKLFIRIHLKYVGGKKAAIQRIRRISRPGLRRYVNKDEIPKVQGGLGLAIVSTSKGVLSDRQARSQAVGGELLCSVW